MSLRFSNGFGAALVAGLLLGLGSSAPAEESNLRRLVGTPVEQFRLPDVTDGKSLTLEQAQGEKATVLVFLGIDCPIGDLYMPRLIDLADRYQAQGVAFLGINSNMLQARDEIAEHARSFGLNFPVLKDKGNVIADALQVERTCEVLVLDAEGIIRYRGAIDDQYGLGFSRDEPRFHYLDDAIKAVREGRDPDTAASSVVGCPIERALVTEQAADVMNLPIAERVNALIAVADRVRPLSEELIEAWAEVAGEEDALIDEVGPVSYSEHVAPIVQNKCQSCHRPGQVAPFSLLNFEEVRRRTHGIQEVVDLRRMPPWHADPRHGDFANDRSLTPWERATLLAWIEQGAPEGDPADLPAPIDWDEGWSIGTPDLVFEMPEAYTVKPEGVEPYKWFQIPTNFNEDVWVQAAEARPGDHSVVHHIIVYAVPPEVKRPRFGSDEVIHLCGYAPGDMPSAYPPGTAKKIPAGSTFWFQLHYTPVGKVKIDRSAVGLKLAKEPVTHEARTMPIANGRFQIPPHDPNYRVESSRGFRPEGRLISFMPHMHLRGKSFQYSLVREGQEPETLLSVPAFDFAWQSYYTLREPIDLQPGDRIHCVAHFDNSEGNPVNPAPHESVKWGDQTWEEMMIGYVDIAFPLAKPAPTAESE